FHVDPSREGFAAFAKSAFEGPINMLNLLKFRDQAAYEDGTKATGAEAYGVYGKVAAPLFAKAGGTVVWRGAALAGLVGPSDEVWDGGFIAAYPNKEAFLSMVMDPEYQAIVHHRTAAILDSRLYAFGPYDGEALFG
ncbi:MAG: DUF1330 domain-containing protein, partial [Pseudomonadota bacterium]